MIGFLAKPFSYFVFFKVYYGFMFDRSFSIIVSAIMAISIGLIEFFLMHFIAIEIGKEKFLIRFKGTTPSRFFIKFWLISLFSIGFSAILSYFIIFGFDERFFRNEISIFKYSNTGFYIFLTGIFMPTITWSVLLYWAVMRDIIAYGEGVLGNQQHEKK